MSTIYENILENLLSNYLGLSDDSLNKHIKSSGYATKERVATIKDLKIIIYSNDHNPPHFHVKSKDLKINAKFSIQDCSLISGEVNSKNLKRITAFYSDPKMILEKIWSKRIQD